MKGGERGMISAQRKDVDYENGSRIKEMIQCRQRQWTSGLCKDKYCEGCVDKDTCFELFGR